MIFHGTTIERQAAAAWPDIQAECAKSERFVVEVRPYDEQREISLQQMKYLHAVVFPLFAESVGCSVGYAEDVLKVMAGKKWFVRTVNGQKFIASKTSLSVKQCNEWLDNIYDFCEQQGCHIPPPDVDWRKNNGKL